MSIFISINNAFAENFDANVTIKPSLTLDISSDKISMELDPASKVYDEKDLTVSVGTNNAHGYKLYLSTSSTSLVNIADNTKTIPTLTNDNGGSGYSIDDLIPNYWGYRLTENSTISTGNYFPFPASATSANSFIISESDTAVNDITTTLGFASKIDYTMPSGTYELTLNFKALPIVTQYYMQNLDPKVCTEDPTVVIDKRDGQTYTISRLKDGNCWMTQNLKLGKYSDTLTLTQEDSNVGASGFVLDGKLATPGNFNFKTVNGYAYQNNSSEYYCTDAYGCYYNWYTATGGSGTTYTAVGHSVNYSICPSGWSLPTGGADGDFIQLYSYYDNPAAMLQNTTENINGMSMPGFLPSGHYRETGEINLGVSGHYWTRTSDSSTARNAFNLYIDASTYRIAQGIKGVGFSVRCILK